MITQIFIFLYKFIHVKQEPMTAMVSYNIESWGKADEFNIIGIF